MKTKGYLTVFGGFWNYVLGFGFFRAYAVIIDPMKKFYDKGAKWLLQVVFYLYSILTSKIVKLLDSVKLISPVG